MKRIVALFALVMMVSTPIAHAQNTIGIGWDNGYSIKVPLNGFGLQFTGSFESVIPEDDNLDTETDVEIAAYINYPMMKMRDTNFNLFGGIGLLPSTREIVFGGKSYDKELGVLLRFGIEPEVMVTNNIGISGKAALEIDMDQGYDGLDDSGSTNLGSWGSVGVHWYF